MNHLLIDLKTFYALLNNCCVNFCCFIFNNKYIKENFIFYFIFKISKLSVLFNLDMEL